ncbi:MAG: GNAT family N-acetyltransferase [Pseudomonadota bacterium]
MKIRRATPGDYDAIARLHAASWKDAYRGLLPDDFIDRRMDAELQKYWGGIGLSEKDFVFVAEDTGREIAGFILLWDQDMPYIESLHVAPGRRSSGVGESLMRAAATELQAGGHSTAHLWVMAGNPRARAFYERLGGKVRGEEQRDIFGYKALNYRVEWSDLSDLLKAVKERTES